MAKVGINLQIRNLENRIVVALNEFSEVPIEAKRIILQELLEKVVAESDKITQKELEEYNQSKAEKEE